MKKRRINISIVVLIIISILSVFPNPIHGDESFFTDEEIAYIKDHNIITVGIDQEFYPYEFIDKDGVYKGIAADYLKLIEVNTGLNFKIIDDESWGETYDKAINGEIDLLACVGMTPERQETFYFSESYIGFQRAIFVDRDGNTINFDDIDNRIIGVQRNSSHYSFLTNYEDVIVKPYEDIEAALRGLIQGEVEGVLGNYKTTRYVIKELGISSIRVSDILEEDFTELSMASKDERLISILNKGLNSITKEQEIVLRNKWLGEEPLTDNSELIQQMILGASILAIIILIISIWAGLMKREIKRRKVTEEALTYAKYEADAANEAKSIFVARMSHELRTPLNSITGLVYLLDKTPKTKIQRSYIKGIDNASHTLLGIIEDVLDFSKIEADKIVLERVVFDIDVMLDKIANLFNAQSEEKNIDFHIIRDTKIKHKLIGDPTRLQQVLVNLLNNAIKFTHTGGVLLHIECLQAESEKYILRFKVKDSGIGIDKSQYKALFKAFHQLDDFTNRKYGGTGLGLNISQYLVNAMGGQISVESASGIGTLFAFDLDLAYSNDSMMETGKLIEGNNKKTIVILKNDRSRKIIVNYLTSWGLQCQDYKVLPPLEELEPEYYGCIIVGLSIAPKEYVNHLYDKYKHLRIIGIISTDTSKMIDSLDDYKLDDILVKPIIPSQLYNTITKMSNCESQSVGGPSEVKNEDLSWTNNHISHKIILAEDNQVNQMVQSEILRLKGYEVLIASNGMECINLLKNNQDTELILMDVHMPIMNGFEATKEIRRFNHQIPIIAMTAISTQEAISDCKKYGMNDFVSKPVEPEALFKMIDTYFQNIENVKEPLLISEDLIFGGGDYIDYASGLKRLGFNQRIYSQSLWHFYNENEKTADEISDLFSNNDYENLSKLLHRIVGSAGNIGAYKLMQSAKILMSQLDSSIEEDIQLSNVEFRDDLKATIDNIKKLINESSPVKPTQILDSDSADKDITLIPLDEILHLKSLLENNDMDAFRVFKEIKNTYILTSKSVELLEGYMAKYDFQKAREELMLII